MEDHNKCDLPIHVTSNYSNLSSKFIENSVDYKKQYCKIYTIRLEQMYPLLEERVKNKWGTEHPIIKVHKLEEQNKKCIIIGTLFKDQKLKPSILKKLSEVNSLLPQPIYTHFTDDSDQLYIEDELQRYQVIGNIDLHILVTGISCALFGVDEGKGKFLVEDYCFADCRQQIPRTITLQKDKYICFISGLDLVKYEAVQVNIDFFTLWIAGVLGQRNEDEAKNTSHLIICGNSIRNDPEIKTTTSMVSKTIVTSENLNATVLLDKYLSKISAAMDVHVMPGQYDPSNHILAQQPMHTCLFPRSKHHMRFKCVTNPYQFEIEGIKMLGTSGQPVTDIINYSRLEKPITALEKCLTWSHLAPTAPDTLGSYPYYSNDPFIIDSCPDVFFAGNQPEFETKLYTGPEGQTVRLICVPQFSSTPSVVQLNLRTLECRLIEFSKNIL